MSKPRRPIEGVAVYYNPAASSFNVFTSIRADPAKRSLAFMESIATAFPPLGHDDPKCREEYWMDFEAAKGQLIYHAYSPVYSLVPPFNHKEKGFSEFYLSFDFGDQTAVLFIARNPMTQQSAVLDEYYPLRQSYATMKLEVYAKVAAILGLNLADDWLVNDYLTDCIGDPRGASLARQFGEGANPIHIRCKDVRTFDGSRLSDHERGWARTNSMLAPSFWCCGPKGGGRPRQHPVRSGSGGYGLAGKCFYCGKQPIPAEPMLVFVDRTTLELQRTHAEQVLVPQREGETQEEKEKRGIEDHLWDCVRYYCQRVQLQDPDALAREDLLSRPLATLTPAERVERIVAVKRKEQEEEAEDGRLFFEEGEYVTTAPGSTTPIRIEDFYGDEFAEARDY